jgi:dienelactone hydrolase
MHRIVFAACIWIGVAGALSAQSLQVIPSEVMVDETAAIRASGLQANERVSIHGELVDGADQNWTSEAEFVTDAQGTVDTTKQAPVKGSYNEISALGLVWSMKPTEKHVSTYVPPHDLAAQTIQFRLLRNGQQISAAQLVQRRITDDIRRIKVEGDLHGVLFLPNNSGPSPGVLVLGGSEGGLPYPKAVWLTSHGYAALALAYFRYEDLPQDLEAIPLEYFGRALAWMAQRPEILPGRIGVLGTSRGGELALQLASMFPQIGAVVAYVPANVRYPACCGNTRVPYAWTWHGEPLAYIPRRELRAPGGLLQLDAAIAVEKTNGPILLVSGQDDGVWESSRMTDDIVSRLKHAHFTQTVVRLDYPHAGHRAGRPEIVPMWHGEIRHPVSGTMENLGGKPQGDADSSLDAIKKVLSFLQSSLQPQANPGK